MASEDRKRDGRLARSFRGRCRRGRAGFGAFRLRQAGRTSRCQATEQPVLVVTAHFAPAVAPRNLVGVVKARVESNLGFRVAGKIAQRLRRSRRRR